MKYSVDQKTGQVPKLFCIILFIATAPLINGVNGLNIIEQLDTNSPAALLAYQKPHIFTVIDQPNLVIRVLENLVNNIKNPPEPINAIEGPTPEPLFRSEKRGLDLGISRGFSGSQAGKHLMGLSAASFANGPGKK